MRKINLLWIALLLVWCGCGQPGNLPVVLTSGNTAKGISYIAYGHEFFRPIEMVCYIDTSRFNPLNALDYTLEDRGIQFFDYVILSGAFIRSDEYGCHLDMTADLRNLLVQRNRLLVPLQKKGIKVLLGIQSHDSASFGSMDIDAAILFARSVYQHLEIYGLNGAEFDDYGADESAWPQLANYDSGGGNSPDEWLLEQWQAGADNFNNIFYLVRQMFPAAMQENKVHLFLRERNYGRFLPDDVDCSHTISDFAASNGQITYSFNTHPERFPSASRLRFEPAYTVDDLPENIDDTGASSWMPVEKYGPLMIDLDGGSGRNILYPFVETFDPDGDRGKPFDRYYAAFSNSNHQAIYYNNLQSLDQAKANPYFINPDFDAHIPEPPEPVDAEGNMSANAKSVSQLVLFNRISKLLFDEKVICSGGNHEKDW